MGDNFDPCECINILNHEGAMQRLMSMLRNSQAACTDNECLEGNTGGSDSQFALTAMMIGWIIMAVVLYFMRPSRRREGDLKTSGGPPDGRNDQDPAPVL
jgi:hypothetical protein